MHLVGRGLRLPASAAGGLVRGHPAVPGGASLVSPEGERVLSEAKNITCLAPERLLHGPLRYGYAPPAQLPGHPFLPALPTPASCLNSWPLPYLATSRLSVATVSPSRLSPSPASSRCPFSDCLATWSPRYRLLFGPPSPPPHWSPWSTNCPRFSCLSTPPHSPAHSST